MVFNKLNKSTMWLITIRSKHNLSNKERDFITELISEEARKTTESYCFVLHDIAETKLCSKILIEGTKMALTNLLSVINDNLPYYRTTYRRHTL